MSGGYFEYKQHTLTDIIDDIERAVNKEINETTIEEFNTAVKYLKVAQVYVHRIDWLLSGDDSEENFHERLKEDLKQLKEK